MTYVMYNNGNVNATRVLSAELIIMIKTEHEVRKKKELRENSCQLYLENIVAILFRLQEH
jgi:hypothetical protein